MKAISKRSAAPSGRASQAQARGAQRPPSADHAVPRGARDRIEILIRQQQDYEQTPLILNSRSNSRVPLPRFPRQGRSSNWHDCNQVIQR